MSSSINFVTSLENTTHSILIGNRFAGKKKKKKLIQLFNSVSHAEKNQVKTFLKTHLEEIKLAHLSDTNIQEKKRVNNAISLISSFQLLISPAKGKKTVVKKKVITDDLFRYYYYDNKNYLECFKHVKSASKDAKKEIFLDICLKEDLEGLCHLTPAMSTSIIKECFSNSLRSRALKSVEFLAKLSNEHSCEVFFENAFKQNDHSVVKVLFPFISPSIKKRVFCKVCMENRKEMVLFMLPYIDAKVLLREFTRAIRAGNKEIIAQLHPYINDESFNTIFMKASRREDTTTIVLLIAFVSEKTLIESFTSSCLFGRVKNIDIFLPYISEEKLQEVFFLSCKEGVVDTIDNFLDIIKNYSLSFSYKEGFIAACKEDQDEIVHLLFEEVSQPIIDEGFLGASINGSQEVLYLLREQVCQEVKNLGFIQLCKEGHQEEVDYYSSSIPQDIKLFGCFEAVLNGKSSIIIQLLETIDESLILEKIKSFEFNGNERKRLLFFYLIAHLSNEGFIELFIEKEKLRIPLLELSTIERLLLLPEEYREQYAPYINIKSNILNHTELLENIFLNIQIPSPPADPILDENSSLLVDRYCDLFESINYDDPEGADYLNPDDIYDDELERVVTVEEQKEALENFIQRVISRSPYIALPSHTSTPEEFERVYKQLEDMLRHILSYLEESSSEEKALYLNLLAIAGRKCGKRNIEETAQLYLRTQQEEETIEILTSFSSIVMYEMRQLTQKIIYSLLPSGSENTHALQVLSQGLNGEELHEIAYSDEFESSGGISVELIQKQFKALLDPLYIANVAIESITTHFKTTIACIEVDWYERCVDWFKSQAPLEEGVDGQVNYLSQVFNLDGDQESLPIGKVTPEAISQMLISLNIMTFSE